MMSIPQLVESSDINAYQSEYARLFLTSHGFANKVPLSDYINQEYLLRHTSGNREREVLYNPKKGFAFTAKLIKQAPDINWIPLQNFTRQQMKQKLGEAMVYIDFGNHPGKDRIPREAAMSGCCIITSKRGSAGNSIDVPIPEEYKYEDAQKNVLSVLQIIRSIFDNYEVHYENQKLYRERIKTEKNTFEEEIKNLFDL